MDANVVVVKDVASRLSGMLTGVACGSTVGSAWAHYKSYRSQDNTMPTHQAVIVSSGRIIQVERIGRLLIVYGRRAYGQQSVSLCKYDGRFRLLPRK